MEESKKHCQTCDEWFDKVKYNDELDQDQCDWCMRGFKLIKKQQHDKN